ncbi:MAG: hypothetical protein V4710_17875 [Verrucomicrobiota bacterium]
MIRALLLLLSFAILAHAQVSPKVSSAYDFQDDDISIALRALARQGDFKLIIESKITGKVTLRVYDKTAREVFDMIVATKKLVVHERDGILYVSAAPIIFRLSVLGLLAIASFLAGCRVMLHGSGGGLRAALGKLLVFFGVLCVFLCFALAWR